MNKLSIIACGGAVIAIGFAVFQLVETRGARLAIADINQDRDGLRHKLRSVDQHLAEANQRAANAMLQATTLKGDFDRLFSKDATTALQLAAEERAKSRFRTPPKSRAQIQTSPRRVASVRSLETTYQALYRQLNLTSEQIAQFKVLVVEDAKRFADLDESARSQGLSTTDPAMLPLYLRADAVFKAKATDCFGADAVPVIQHFAETLFLREPLVQVANELFWTNTPLSEGQANQLVEIMWRNMRDGTGRANYHFANPDAMKSDAKEVLSTPQLTVWHAYIDYLVESTFATARPNPFVR